MKLGFFLKKRFYFDSLFFTKKGAVFRLLFSSVFQPISEF